MIVFKLESVAIAQVVVKSREKEKIIAMPGYLVNRSLVGNFRLTRMAQGISIFSTYLIMIG